MIYCCAFVLIFHAQYSNDWDLGFPFMSMAQSTVWSKYNLCCHKSNESIISVYFQGSFSTLLSTLFQAAASSFLLSALQIQMSHYIRLIRRQRIFLCCCFKKCCRHFRGGWLPPLCTILFCCLQESVSQDEWIWALQSALVWDLSKLIIPKAE